MDSNTLIKTESRPEDFRDALGAELFGDSFVPSTSLSPSEYQPSPSPETLSRSELLPKALIQNNPMAQVNNLPSTSKPSRPSDFQGDRLTMSKTVKRQKRRTLHTRPRDILTERDGNPPTKPILMN